MGHRVAVIGNVPPLDMGLREPPEVVERWAPECLDKGAPSGGMLLSFGGGVSLGTPPENIDALLKAAHKWSKSVTIMAKAKAGEGHGVELSGVG
jgi:uroporphyrinogen-III decarboxylase